MHRFKLVGSVLESIALFYLGAFILFSALIDSVPLKHFLIILTVLIISMFIYRVTIIYDDKIVVKFPMLFFKKEFIFSEIKKIRMYEIWANTSVSFEFTKRVIFFKSVTYSGGGLRLDDINQFFTEKKIPVKYYKG